MRRLVALFVAGGLLTPLPAYADHDYWERDRCYDYDCDYGGGGDGGYSGGHGGYQGGGGRSGDMEQDGDNNCRNFCFYGIPGPGGEPRG